MSSNLKSVFLVAGCSALALVTFSPLPAQNVCIPSAGGVPALNGPPNWWQANLPGWPELDDPRWRGAFLQTFGGGGASPHVSFLALRTATDLYFSWRVDVDPQMDDEDQIWMAFSPGGGEDDLLLNIVPFAAANTDHEADLPAAITPGERPGGGGAWGPTPGGAVPDWLTDPGMGVRVWRDVAAQTWAVQMQVPIQAGFDNGLDFASTFEMWFEVQVVHPGPSVVAYDYPLGVDLATVSAGTDTTGWADVRRDVEPTDASCIHGVSIAVADVGTVSAGDTCADETDPLSSSIRISDGLGSTETNTFCARPLNETGGAVGAGEVQATFRIANWGTQADWNDVSDPDSLWIRINPGLVTGPAIADGDLGDLHFDWTLTEEEACDFDPQPPDIDCAAFPTPTRRRHQCMLVQLTGTPDLTFSRSSVYRNMNFVDASVFRREAEVSVVGLEPLSAGARDVFLYVQVDNMPPRVEEGSGGEDGERPECAGQTSHCVPPLEKDPYGALRETTPTYQVHAFHDTGREVRVGEEMYRLLAPQIGFGYFVSHEGPLQGWRHALEGAELIAPSYYLIGVPEGGVAAVTNVIEALEGDGGGGPDLDHRFSFSFHGGFNSVQGSFGDAVEGSLSLGADLEYPVHDRFTLELFAGYDDFDTAFGGDELLHLSLNLKVYSRLSDRLRWLGLVGLGLYEFDSGPSEDGYNLGTGLRFPVRSNLWLDATVRYHVVKLGDADFTFLTTHWGVSRRF